MCRGVYQVNPFCQLFVQGVVGISSPAPTDARTIRFLVDTGSTSTMLSPMDVVRLGVSYDAQQKPHFNRQPLPFAGDATGVGGALDTYHLKGVFLTIVSSESGLREKHTEYIPKILVAGLEYEQESIIGMDLLRRFKLTIDSEIPMIEFARAPIKGTGYLVQHS